MTIAVSQCVRRVWERVKIELERHPAQAIYPEHELLGLIREKGSLAVRVLRQLGVDLEGFRADLEKSLADGSLLRSTGKGLLLAGPRPRSGGEGYVGTHTCLLQALKGPATLLHDLLSRQGVDVDRLRSALQVVANEAGSADGGVISVESMIPFSDSVMDQIEYLKYEQFDKAIRHLWKCGLYEDSPILSMVPPAELERHAGVAVPELVALLGHSKPEVRWAAARALGCFGPVARPAVPVLVAFLQQEDELVAEAALMALLAIDPEGSSWWDRIDDFLKHPSPRLRLAGLRASWGRTQDVETVLPVLEALLADADGRVRAQAAAFLSNLITRHNERRKQALPLFRRREGPDPEQLVRAFQPSKPDERLIGRLLPSVIRGIGDSDYAVQGSMAQTLIAVGPLGRTAVGALVEALRQREHCVGPSFAGKSNSDYPWTHLLAQLLTSALSAVVANAEEVPAELLTALADIDPVVRRAAAAALGRAGPAARTAASRLTDLLADPDAVVRVWAAGALWRIERRQGVAAILTQSLQQPGEAADIAVQMLAEMGPEAAGAFPALLHTVATHSGQVRSQAALALFKMGYEADAVVPVLQQAAGSDDFVERASAVAALHEVDPSSQATVGLPTKFFDHIDSYDYHVLDVPENEAVAVWDDAIRADPGDAQAYLLRGLAHYRRDDVPSAIADLDRAIELDPRDAYAYRKRAHAHTKNQQPEKVIADASEAIRLDPQNHEGYRLRALACKDTEDFDQALADCNRALELNPNAKDALNIRGIAHKNKGDYDRAIADYDRALELDPEDARVLVNRALAYRGKRDFARAAADYEEAIRVNPRYANGLNNLAWLRATCPEAGLRDGKKALELAQQACALVNWQKGQCLARLGAAYGELGQFDEAVRWAKEALRFTDGLKATQVEDLRQNLETLARHTPMRQG